MSSRFQQHEILDHPFREQLWNLIRDEPGIPFLHIHERLRARPDSPARGYGTVVHHLYQLQRFGLITSRRAGRWRRFYHVGSPFPGGATTLALAQNPITQRLLRIILAEPGLSQGDVCERFTKRLPRTRQAIAYHLNRLVEGRLITISTAGRLRKHHATALASHVLAFEDGQGRLMQTPLPTIPYPADGPPKRTGEVAFAAPPEFAAPLVALSW